MAHNTNLKSIPQDKWDLLASKKIFFGHQSVGFNILDGVQDILRENANIRLTIVQTRNAAEINGPMLAHSPIGKNEDPKSKIDDFREVMDDGMGAVADIALFKLCYIDVTGTTDVENLFNHYCATMDSLIVKYPNVRFIHCTVPLTTMDTGIKLALKRLLGKSGGVENNWKRNEFNKKVRQKYGSKGDVFDIADIESTLPDGTREQGRYKGSDCFSLVPQYTNDGGHLNDAGRKCVAEKMLQIVVLKL